MKLLQEINLLRGPGKNIAKILEDQKKRMGEDLKRMNRFHAVATESGNTATAASISNVMANYQQSIKLMDAAIADVGKQYDPPGSSR